MINTLPTIASVTLPGSAWLWILGLLVSFVVVARVAARVRGVGAAGPEGDASVGSAPATPQPVGEQPSAPREPQPDSEGATVPTSPGSRFVFVAAHDLKAPLRGIGTLTELLREDCKDILPASAIDYLARIETRVSRMDALIEELLTYERAGGNLPDSELVDVAELVADAVDVLDFPDGFVVRCEEVPSPYVPRIAMRAIVQNLLANVVRHHDRDSGHVLITGVVDGGRVRIAIEDDGPGVAEADRERIFEPFVSLSQSPEGESTGMGLAIVRRVVNSVGGEVWCEAAPGRGARFVVSVPVARSVGVR